MQVGRDMLLQVLLCFRAYFPKVCIVPCSYFSGAFNVKFHSHLVQNAEKKYDLGVEAGSVMF